MSKINVITDYKTNEVWHVRIEFYRQNILYSELLFLNSIALKKDF